MLKPCTSIIIGNLDVLERFIFNEQFDNERRWLNKLLGLLYVAGRMEVSDFVVYSGSSIIVNNDAYLKIGSGYANCRLNINCFYKITIGNNVSIGPEVMIRDSDNHHIKGSRCEMAPIVIEDDVWIGARCIILKGVTIGRGSVVAAGSVVIRSCPPYSLIAGNPAVVKKTCISIE